MAPASTVFGRVRVPHPWWNRGPGQSDGPKTFRPMSSWLKGPSSLEMLYLETKWSSRIPFAKTADRWKQVLPVASNAARQLPAH
jgi:hypothetical protein